MFADNSNNFFFKKKEITLYLFIILYINIGDKYKVYYIQYGILNLNGLPI